jgi:nucleotide-binding universal stress UspA family protein
MFDRILTPTDGSDTARKAIDLGIELAGVHDASVHVLYVLKTHFPLEEHSDDLLEDQQRAADSSAQAIAEQASAKGLDTVTEVRQGVPHRQILSYVDAADIDLIVMGTHGRTGLGHYLLGSTTEKVVRLADVEVLTSQTVEPQM